MAIYTFFRNKDVEHRERMHAKWLEDIDHASTVPVHYSNVLYDGMPLYKMTNETL